MSVPQSLRFTYEDYVLLPEDRRHEVIDGELYLTPAPTPYHQLVKQRIERLLLEHVEGRALGQILDAPCDVVLSRFDVLQPDIFFVSSSRLAIIGEKFITGAPDLVVEVLSPGTRRRDRISKAKRYARFGVRGRRLRFSSTRATASGGKRSTTETASCARRCCPVSRSQSRAFSDRRRGDDSRGRPLFGCSRWPADLAPDVAIGGLTPIS